MFFCVLILTGLIYISLFDDSKDVWHKIGVIIGLIFLGLIWFGISYAFLINKDKCKKCRISIKDDYYYCNKCDFEKETEFRNSKNLHCLVCDIKIDSFDAFRGHYVKEHENQPVAEGICQPPFSKIRTTDTVYIKKGKSTVS